MTILTDIQTLIRAAWDHDARWEIPNTEYLLVIPYPRNAEFYCALTLSELGNHDPRKGTYMNCRIAFAREGEIAVYGRP